MTEYSGEAAGSFSSRDSSRCASLQRLLGHTGLLDLLAQFIDCGGLFALFAQFLLDGLELLAQEILALRLAHLLLRLALNLLAKLQHFQLMCEEARSLYELLAYRVELQQLLA